MLLNKTKCFKPLTYLRTGRQGERYEDVASCEEKDLHIDSDEVRWDGACQLARLKLS